MTSSIVDVAREAGVSTATVSRALRGLPRVSPSTRRRVLRTAEELAYVISPSASTLVTGRTRTVGVVVPAIQRWFYGQVVAGIDSVLRENDHDLLLYNLADGGGRARFFERMPPRRRVDGVVVVTLPLAEAELDALRDLHVPLALVGVGPSSASDASLVRVDEEEAAAGAVQHLLNLGHRRIGLIAGLAAEPLPFVAAEQRRRGYLRALRRAGVPIDPALDIPGNFEFEGGAQAMAQLLTLADAPTAVFAASDEMALGALRTLQRMGLRVPQDMSVVGFDDHELAALVDLTTVSQGVHAQGATAARHVLAALAGDEAPRASIVPTQLVVRGSTAALR
jgi:DNA-binding LacI/PurR family transcriptional regulator